MNFLYRFFYVLSGTSWMLIFNSLKIGWTVGSIPWLIIFLILVTLVLGSAGLSLLLIRKLSKEILGPYNDIEQKDIYFLPSYIAYCLIGFNVDILWKLIIIWLFISFLIGLTLAGFNISYLLFGYHYYQITTEGGKKIFMLSRQKMKNPKGQNFDNVKRINDYTFIERKKK